MKEVEYVEFSITGGSATLSGPQEGPDLGVPIIFG
jgi:hypothetical protein